jgi:cob(I)alamin adenosyltransferase
MADSRRRFAAGLRTPVGRGPVGRLSAVKIYTRKGDDGTTGLYYGGRVPKNSALPVAYGAVDEAQSAIGLARSEVRVADTSAAGAELDDLLVHLERDLWVVMADLATEADRRDNLVPGTSLVTEEMVAALEGRLDDYEGRFTMPTEFVVPGQTRLSAMLDVARTVVRRAERDTVAALADGSLAGVYLNRLSDLLWMLARFVEGDATLPTRQVD